MITVAGGIILAVLFFVFIVVGGFALAVAFVGPWAAVGIAAILIGVALICCYAPLNDADQPARRAPKARKRASD
jgi:protein-S-isoprenylcysteine O-methyltransferase Ste14